MTVAKALQLVKATSAQLNKVQARHSVGSDAFKAAFKRYEAAHTLLRLLDPQAYRQYIYSR